MSTNRLTLAVAHYDRHVPFLDNTVSPPGFDFVVKEVGQSVPGRDGTARHARMLRDGEFEAAEVSLSSYLIAKERGAPFTAIPVVPRRLYCQSLFFVRADSPLHGPEDLAGKVVGLSMYQTTLSVLARGDLEHEYGVPWKSITWVLNAEEVLPLEVPPGVKVERVPANTTVDQLLLQGKLDAAILPHPPSSLSGDGGRRVRRLFTDPRAAERAYYSQHGYWPVMHLVVIRQDAVEQQPGLPLALWNAYDEAKKKLRWRWEDPNWSILAWGRHYLEEEQAVFGGDPWRDGMKANRANLERFMTYSREQGLISRVPSTESLFHESLWDT